MFLFKRETNKRSMSFFNWSSAATSKKIDDTVAVCEHNLVKYSLQQARILKQLETNPSGPMRLILRNRLIDLVRNINAAEQTLKECNHHRSGINGINDIRMRTDLAVAATTTIANARMRTLNPKLLDKALRHFDEAPNDGHREISAAAEAYSADVVADAESAISAAVDEMMALATFSPSERTNNDPPQPPPVAEPMITGIPQQRVGMSMQ
jgi:hypothetical protein